RLKERRKRRSEGSARRLYFSENNDEVTKQLMASVDFLMDLCDTISIPDDANFTNRSHQAVDFILGYEVEGHKKHLKLAEGYVEVGRLLTLYHTCNMTSCSMVIAS
nr:protein multipolar spindle 1 isoform X2 [Tanacetum cinerariifolium]